MNVYKVLFICLLLLFLDACSTRSSHNEKHSKLESTYSLRLNTTSGTSHKYDIKNETDLMKMVDEKEIDKINRISTEVDYGNKKNSLGDFIMRVKHELLSAY